MSFRAFTRALGLADLPQLPAISPRRFVERETEDAIHELIPWLDQLTTVWEPFIRTGGFPRAVTDQLNHGRVQPDFVNALWDESAATRFAADMPAAAAHALLVRLLPAALVAWLLNE